jgi:hypothetical protein
MVFGSKNKTQFQGRMDWVAPHLTGGIGNRLFEFAAAAGLAEKWGRPAAFFLPRCSSTDHGPFENIFKLFPSVPLVESAESWETLEEPRDHMYRYVPFSDIPVAGPAVVHGYRQSATYFPSGGVKADFEAALGAETAAMIRRKIPRDAWFIHVRLGDYKILQHHQVNLKGYYETCLNRIPRGAPLILFSDEPDLCSEYFMIEAGSRSLDFSVCTNKDELVNLYMMSLCGGGAITANSTFSWWGAYFAWQNATQNAWDNAWQNGGTAFQAFYPSVWGQGMPPPVDLIPSWGVCIDTDEASE